MMMIMIMMIFGTDHNFNRFWMATCPGSQGRIAAAKGGATGSIFVAQQFFPFGHVKRTEKTQHPDFFPTTLHFQINFDKKTLRIF